jgi:hypothetical protein
MSMNEAHSPKIPVGIASRRQENLHVNMMSTPLIIENSIDPIDPGDIKSSLDCAKKDLMKFHMGSKFMGTEQTGTYNENEVTMQQAKTLQSSGINFDSNPRERRMRGVVGSRFVYQPEGNILTANTLLNNNSQERFIHPSLLKTTLPHLFPASNFSILANGGVTP